MRPTSVRIASKLAEPTHRRLDSYALAASAAGVGMLALLQSAQAQIVYTPAHTRIPNEGAFFLDLNNDGISDFKFSIFTYDEDCRPDGAKSCFIVDGAFMWIFPLAAGNTVVGQPPYAALLPGGSRIGPRQPFNSSTRDTMGGVRYNFGVHYSGPWADSGKSVNGRYVGMKFVVDGETHYGWARFDVKIFRKPESKIYALLTGYAYETVPNKPILAGQTKEVGEAGAAQRGSLGHLAAGASAIAAWRPEK